MREFRSYGSVRGVLGNRHPYRDRGILQFGAWMRGCVAAGESDPSFPPSKANDDKFVVLMVLKCCSWRAGLDGCGRISEEAGFFAIRDTTALEEVSLFENRKTVTARLPP
jgi:hypothetical protein